MSIFGKIFKTGTQKAPEQAGPQSKAEPAPREETWMLSQFAAFYLDKKEERFRTCYLRKLTALGFSGKEAEALFNFDCAAIRKYNKSYLLHENFIKLWFMGLGQPFFQNYPKEKEDILKERFFTMSEICKFIDEAEWHFWNSHERATDAAWAEIYCWRLQGAGGEFAMEYFDMMADATGVPREKIGAVCSQQGAHLSKYRW